MGFLSSFTRDERQAPLSSYQEDRDVKMSLKRVKRAVRRRALIVGEDRNRERGRQQLSPGKEKGSRGKSRERSTVATLEHGIVEVKKKKRQDTSPSFPNILFLLAND